MEQNGAMFASVEADAVCVEGGVMNTSRSGPTHQSRMRAAVGSSSQKPHQQCSVEISQAL